MKLGVAIYCSNLENYPQQWIDTCVNSILRQTYKDFKLYYLNYTNRDTYNGPGYDEVSITDIKSFLRGEVVPSEISTGWVPKWKHPLPNYADAMNFIYEKVFQECDVVANVNIDDYYDERRFELLMQTIEEGADIASSNYILFNDEGVIRKTDFAKLDVKKELLRGNNIVSNPCHLMRREVFEKIKFDSSLVPKEDLAYWQQAVKEGFKIVIRPEYLHYYRIHQNQMGNIKNHADVC